MRTVASRRFLRERPAAVVQLKDDETVVFSWIVGPSRVARDAGWKRMMDDPRMKPDRNKMPFDGKRMICGGFVPIVDNLRPAP